MAKLRLENPQIAVSSDLLQWSEAFMLAKYSTRLSERTIEFYRHGLTKFFRFCELQGVAEVREITADLIRRYIVGLEQLHKPGGVHALWRAVRAFLNWYEEEIDDPDYRNPARKIKVRPAQITPLDPADITAINAMIRACERGRGYTGLRDKLIMLFLLDTGVRASELLSLTTETVNPITGIVQVIHGKGGKSRTVYIGQKTRRILRKFIAFHEIDGFIFRNDENSPLTRSGLETILERRAKQAKVRVQRPHSFRRLFALTMLRNGVDIYSLALLMGHADTQVLRRYLKLTEADTFQAHLKGSPVDRLL